MVIRRGTLVLVLLGVLAVGAAAEGKPDRAGQPLKITAVNLDQQDRSYPRDARVLECFRSIIVERTGVDATWVDPAPVWTRSIELVFQEWLAAGTMPEVIREDDLFFAWKEGSDLWVQKRLSWTWDAARVRKLLPGYAARLQKYGLSVEEVLEANAYAGENWAIPIEFSFTQMPGLSSLPEAKAAWQNYYAVGFCDDVLKRIFPTACSEAELLQVFAKKEKLTPQDVTSDIPIEGLEDLYEYLKKVKSFNLKVGEKPLIPGALCASSQNRGSIDWSLRTIIGYHWSWPLVFVNPPTFEGSFFLRTSPEYLEYLRWWNRLYNEGLLDPELFVMKDDQFNTKIINGEYAVINFWSPVTEAREVGRERGYDFRYFPLFYGGIKPVFNNTTGYISLRTGSVAITTSVSEADLPRVARWLDWYLSEEHDVLSYWGSPDMYTGTGKARRYRPEFKEVEDWAVYGATGDRDGAFFGLQHAYPAVAGDVKMPLGGISFFYKDFTYPEAPYFVYPKDPARVAALTDIWKVSHDTIYRTVWDDYTLWTHANRAMDELMMGLPADRVWEQYLADHGQEYAAIFIRLITGSSADFDRNLSEYRRFFADADTAGLERQGAAWMAWYYRTEILPKRFTP